MTPNGYQKTAKLALFVSGRGSNAQAILEAIEQGRLSHVSVALALSNRPDCDGLRWLARQGIPCYSFQPRHWPDRPTCDGQILKVLQAHNIEWIALAGYDRIVTPVLTRAYAGRMVNMHPSLLPAHGGVGMVGLKVHEAVLAAGDRLSGCTVHEVTETVDDGPILGQATVPVMAGDTPHTLAARVLEAEHRLYPEVLQRIITASAQPAHLAD